MPYRDFSEDRRLLGYDPMPYRPGLHRFLAWLLSGRWRRPSPGQSEHQED